MTNNQSKYLICEYNFPPPLLSQREEARIVTEMSEKYKAVGRRRNNIMSGGYSIWWNYDLDKWVCRIYGTSNGGGGQKGRDRLEELANDDTSWLYF